MTKNAIFIYDYYPLQPRSFSFLVVTRVLIELNTSSNLKIKEEAVFYYVKKIWFQIFLFNI